MRKAICIQTGFIRHETSLKHSVVFMFEMGQEIVYRSSQDGQFLVFRPDRLSIGFPVDQKQFHQNFLDLSEFRQTKIDLILE